MKTIRLFTLFAMMAGVNVYLICSKPGDATASATATARANYGDKAGLDPEKERKENKENKEHKENKEREEREDNKRVAENDNSNAGGGGGGGYHESPVKHPVNSAIIQDLFNDLNSRVANIDQIEPKAKAAAKEIVDKTQLREINGINFDQMIAKLEKAITDAREKILKENSGNEDLDERLIKDLIRKGIFELICSENDWTHRFEELGDKVNSIAVADRYIAAGADDNKACVWDRTQRYASKLFQHNSRVNAIAISPKNQLLACGLNNNIVAIYDIQSGRHIKDEHFASSIKFLEYSPNGQFLVVILNTGTLYVFDLQKNVSVQQYINVETAHFSPGSAYLAIAQPNQIDIVSTNNWNRDKTINPKYKKLTSLAFSPDYRMIVCASQDVNDPRQYAVQVFNKQADGSWKLVVELPNVDQRYHVKNLHFSPNGQSILGLFETAGARAIWDLAKPKNQAKLIGKDTSWASSVAFLDDNYVICGHQGGSVSINAINHTFGWAAKNCWEYMLCRLVVKNSKTREEVEALVTADNYNILKKQITALPLKIELEKALAEKLESFAPSEPKRNPRPAQPQPKKNNDPDDSGDDGAGDDSDYDSEDSDSEYDESNFDDNSNHQKKPAEGGFWNFFKQPRILTVTGIACALIGGIIWKLFYSK